MVANVALGLGGVDSNPRGAMKHTGSLHLSLIYLTEL